MFKIENHFKYSANVNQVHIVKKKFNTFEENSY